MSFKLNTLKPLLVQWASNATNIVTLWANQKHLRPPTYPYNVLEVMSFTSETGSSAPDLIYTTRPTPLEIVRCRVSYKLLTVNLQVLAGEVTENSLDALDAISDALAALQDSVERTKFTEANMIPLMWDPVVNLTAIQHHEFISRASVDVMFRVSNTVTETLEPTDTIITDLAIESLQDRTIVAEDPTLT